MMEIRGPTWRDARPAIDVGRHWTPGLIRWIWISGRLYSKDDLVRLC